MPIKLVHKRYLQNSISGNYVTLDYLDLIEVAELAVVLSRDKVEILFKGTKDYLSKRNDSYAYYEGQRLAKATLDYEKALEILHHLTALGEQGINRTSLRLFNLNPEAVTIMEGEED